ncbi:MAG: D-alanyl-D-alanine carboxypeptidase [Candidatus Yonathbacteria bacterium]|nr:D-alanyl-D-alanine carboxypeptidase [Candidatus Yonathbacteria bacterium]NTW47875.1 D-alanyl-D-alanine carboxypeptidase [Candidatus Yonathbacteria bacterium]
MTQHNTPHNAGEKKILAVRIIAYTLFAISLYITVPAFFNIVASPHVLSQVACIACDVNNPSFTDVSIDAKSVYVYDIKNDRVLFSKNAESQLPLASVTKVMTALVAEEYLPPAFPVRILTEDLSTEGESGFFEGDVFSSSDLIDIVLTASSNDGAYALARVAGARIGEGNIPEKTFIHAMNEKAQTLGLSQTFFLNATGLDESSSVAGAYGSARDMAHLFGYIAVHKPVLLDATAHDELYIAGRIFRNTDLIVGNIPGLLGSKTGFTDLAGGNLVVVFEPEPMRPVVVVVLGSTREHRFSDVKNLVSAAIRTFLPPDIRSDATVSTVE